MLAFNFTTEVRKSLAMAREEAVRLRHEYVGTEHILLGLIREGETLATAVLRNLSVDLDALRDDIEKIAKRGHAQIVGPDLPYTSRAKKVLELAMSEAHELNHSYVGTEHLLLGLLREEQGIAAMALRQRGLVTGAVLAETLRLLGTAAPSTVAVTIELRHGDGSSSRQMFGTVREAIRFLEARDPGPP